MLAAAAGARLASPYDDSEAATAAEGLGIRVVRADPPSAIVAWDDEDLGVFAHDDGALVGAILADDPAVRRCGERVCERHRERSIPT